MGNTSKNGWRITADDPGNNNGTTAYHARYFAHELTLCKPAADTDRLPLCASAGAYTYAP